MTKQMTNDATRRAVMTGLAVTPLAALPAFPGGDELPRLIADYYEKYKAFDAADAQLNQAELNYHDLHHCHRYAMNLLTQRNYEVGAQLSREQCERAIHQDYESQRSLLYSLEETAPAVAALAKAAFDAMEAENIKYMNRLFDEEEARQEEFGLTVIRQRWHHCCDAEKAATTALYAYPCKTLTEIRMKAKAILESPLQHDIEETTEVILRSFLGEAPLDAEDAEKVETL
jgi:hypothetical protein